MSSQEEDRERTQSISEPVKSLVANASDEQLVGMVGPDRRFYSKEALQAAADELELRRMKQASSGEKNNSFEIAAFALGPAWYFYNGMIGRGVLILLYALGAFFGLRPVAETIGIPTIPWIVIIVFFVAMYCGRFGARDLAESTTQARLMSPNRKTEKDRK